MDTKIIDTMHACTQGSLAGTMAFPEVVGRLMACGVESYHADLYRFEKTYYLPNGESHVEKMAIPPVCIAPEFCAESVRDAVYDSQQGKQTYLAFLRRIMEAGATQYFVYFTGQCAVYIGRDGSEHIEKFPSAT